MKIRTGRATWAAAIRAAKAPAGRVAWAAAIRAGAVRLTENPITPTADQELGELLFEIERAIVADLEKPVRFREALRWSRVVFKAKAIADNHTPPEIRPARPNYPAHMPRRSIRR